MIFESSSPDAHEHGKVILLNEMLFPSHQLGPYIRTSPSDRVNPPRPNVVLMRESGLLNVSPKWTTYKLPGQWKPLEHVCYKIKSNQKVIEKNIPK